MLHLRKLPLQIQHKRTIHHIIHPAHLLPILSKPKHKHMFVPVLAKRQIGVGFCVQDRAAGLAVVRSRIHRDLINVSSGPVGSVRPGNDLPGNSSTPEKRA